MNKSLTKKEIRLVLGNLDPVKYDDYFPLWEFVDKEEKIVLENKLLRMLRT